MKFDRPALWYVVCYMRGDSEFETLSRFGVSAVSTGHALFRRGECPPFDLSRDKVFQLEDDFNWRQTGRIHHRNSELFRQWEDLIAIGWRPHMTAIQYLSLDLLRMLSSNK